MFFVYATQDTTGMIRAFLRVNCRFQVYTTQDTTGMIRAFLQVNCRFQVYATQDTTALIRAFFELTVDLRYTLPRVSATQITKAQETRGPCMTQRGCLSAKFF